MFLRTGLTAIARRSVVPSGARALSVTRAALSAPASGPKSPADFKVSNTLAEATDPDSLLGPGGKKNEMPDSFEQATGIERLELLAKAEGIDLFDDKPLIQDKKGTPDDPVIVDSYDTVRYIGCTGWPQGSNGETSYLRLELGKIARDWESGCCYKLNYIGPPLDEHH